MENRIHNRISLKKFRKDLRNNLTPAEARLWSFLQNSQLEGRKFRRQHSVGNYILDFYCPSEKLAIELDGQGHLQPSVVAYDEYRTHYLETLGIRVIRFWNREIFSHPEHVLDQIKANFQQKTQ